MSEIGPHTNFLFEAGKVLPQFVAKSVTRILGIRKDGGPADHRGTAVMCRIEGRQAFVTANHVLSEIEKSDDYRCAGISASPGGFQAQYLRFADIDVAIIMPDNEIPVREGRVFWPGDWCDRREPAVMAGDYMLVYGFPARFSRFSTFLPGSISEGYTHCTWVRPRHSQAQDPLWKPFAEIAGYPPIPDELIQPWQFCLNFDEPTGPLKTQEGELVTSAGILQEHAGLYVDLPSLPEKQPFGAFGLSGSPVWRFSAAEAAWSLDRWSPESARLAGIITHWNEKRSYLVATRFSEIVTTDGRVT